MTEVGAIIFFAVCGVIGIAICCYRCDESDRKKTKELQRRIKPLVVAQLNKIHADSLTDYQIGDVADCMLEDYNFRNKIIQDFKIDFNDKLIEAKVVEAKVVEV